MRRCGWVFVGGLQRRAQAGPCAAPQAQQQRGRHGTAHGAQGQRAQALSSGLDGGGLGRGGVRRKHFGGSPIHHCPVHPGHAGGVRAQQSAVAQQVDAPGHPARKRVNAAQRVVGKRQGAGEPRHGQAVLNVGACFGLAQRVQMKTRHHPLRQLLQLGPGQQLAQLGLPNQDDLQQLALVGF